jgi:hypothetical protein
VCILLISPGSPAPAQEIFLAWDPVPEAAGYIFFYGNAPGVYPFAVDTSHATQYPISELLKKPRTHYFAVKSYNASGLESPFEVLPPLDFCAWDSELLLCRYDRDGDDVVFFFDNCPGVYNPDQRDSCADGIGDACRDAGATCADRPTDDAPPASGASDPQPPAFEDSGTDASAPVRPHTPPACQTDRECPASRYCLAATGTCVRCLDDRHCDDGLYCTGIEACRNHVCVGGSDPCPDAGYCDDAEGICRAPEPPPECFLDSDCADNDLFCAGPLYCDDGICRRGAPPCPAPWSCDENLRRCLLPATPLPAAIRIPALQRRHCRFIWLRLDRLMPVTSIIGISFTHDTPLAGGLYSDYTRHEHILGNFVAIPVCIEAGAAAGCWSVVVETLSRDAEPLAFKATLILNGQPTPP